MLVGRAGHKVVRASPALNLDNTAELALMAKAQVSMSKLPQFFSKCSTWESRPRSEVGLGGVGSGKPAPRARSLKS